VVALDAGDLVAVTDLMRGHEAALCALPYYFNESITRAAIEGGCHFCDLGGNTEIVFQQKKLHDAAMAAGVSVIPDCGLAPAW
jgi:lysine 6-dehydrogenase